MVVLLYRSVFKLIQIWCSIITENISFHQHKSANRRYFSDKVSIVTIPVIQREIRLESTATLLLFGKLYYAACDHRLSTRFVNTDA